MKPSIVCLLLAGMALGAGCGSSSSSTSTLVAPPSLTGAWTITLSMNGTTQSIVQGTLVSELANGNSCALATATETLNVQVLNLSGCFIADSSSKQGVIGCPACGYNPQAVLLVTTQNSNHVSMALIETDSAQHVYQFSGTGTASDKAVSGNWTCGTSDCAGWIGTFSGTAN